jgi:hypothetical protein
MSDSHVQINPAANPIVKANRAGREDALACRAPQLPEDIPENLLVRAAYMRGYSGGGAVRVSASVMVGRSNSEEAAQRQKETKCTTNS